MGNGRTFTEMELEALVAELNRDGICVLRGAVDSALVAEWRDAFDRLFAERQARAGGLAPREQARFYLTLPWTAPFSDERVFANAGVLGVLDRLFPQEYVMVQLGADVPVQGSDYQEIHRDFRPLFSHEIVTPLYAVAVNMPLVEVTEENGPFQHARGTHVMPRETALAKVQSGEIPLESIHLQPGDITIRSPLGLHRGSPNRTERPRPMVVMGYVMHWLHTPKVDLNVPRSDYDRLSERARTLLRCNIVEALEEKSETYIDFKY
jgi:ectoine hydroxylase-related dioxygenase (phytanoyl-CoA dioxygenase family)